MWDLKWTIRTHLWFKLHTLLYLSITAVLCRWNLLHFMFEHVYNCGLQLSRMNMRRVHLIWKLVTEKQIQKNIILKHEFFDQAKLLLLFTKSKQTNAKQQQ